MFRGVKFSSHSPRCAASNGLLPSPRSVSSRARPCPCRLGRSKAGTVGRPGWAGRVGGVGRRSGKMFSVRAFLELRQSELRQRERSGERSGGGGAGVLRSGA